MGLCAEGCASYTFPKILGKSKATEMLLLNYKLYANEAHKFNLVSQVFKQDELNSILWPRIVNYSKLPVESMKITKSLMVRFELKELESACEKELTELCKRFETQDFVDGVIRFMQRKSKL